VSVVDETAFRRAIIEPDLLSRVIRFAGVG
jgi:hypothetical protein